MIFKLLYIFIFAILVNADDTKSSCFNKNLQQLGCTCTSPVYFTESCTNGILNLNCIFRNDSIEDAIHQMNSYCWNQVYLENIDVLSSYAFQNLGFNFECEFKLKNVSIIEDLAFKTINNDVELTIEIDSSNLHLKEFSFGFINAREVKLINNRNLPLSTSLFHGSSIETLTIQYSNLTNFERDSKFLKIANLIVSNSIIDDLLNDSNKISGFEQFEKIKIQSNGLTSLKPKIFSDCCSNLNELHLNDNLIKSIDQFTFKGLRSLQYLNLENNPINLINDSAFMPFKHSLKKLNLKSTQIVSLGNNLKNMPSLREVFLSQTQQMTDLSSILGEQIQYLDLQNSNLLFKVNDLNNFLNEIDLILNSNNNLLYLDARGDNFNFNEAKFKKSFNDLSDCLWFNLKKILIRINEDHECNCALFYLYENLTNFYFPYESKEYISYKQLTFDQMNNITLWIDIILPLMPKCYRKLWLETYNLDKINENIFKCGFNPILQDCANNTRSTTIRTTMKSTTRITLAPTMPTHKIEFKYTTEILASVLLFAILIIIIVILRAKHNYQSKFLKIFKKNFEHLTEESKELNNFSATRQSFNVYSFNPEHLLQQ